MNIHTVEVVLFLDCAALVFYPDCERTDYNERARHGQRLSRISGREDEHKRMRNNLSVAPACFLSPLATRYYLLRVMRAVCAVVRDVDSLVVVDLSGARPKAIDVLSCRCTKLA